MFTSSEAFVSLLFLPLDVVATLVYWLLYGTMVVGPFAVPATLSWDSHLCRHVCLLLWQPGPPSSVFGKPHQVSPDLASLLTQP